MSITTARRLLAAAMASATVLLFLFQRDLTFAYDEIDWFTTAANEPVSEFFKPLGGHLSVLPFVIFKGILEIFGASYTAFGVVQLVLLLGLSWLVFDYARRRVDPVIALVPAVVLLFMGTSWIPLLLPLVGIQYLSGLLPGIAALLLIERDERVSDLAACLLLIVAILGFSTGLAFLAGAAIWLALSPRGRRRLWVVGVPSLLYLGWWIWATQFDSADVRAINVLLLPLYLADSAAVALTSFFGVKPVAAEGRLTSVALHGFDPKDLALGLALLMVEVAAVSLLVLWLRGRRPLPASFWAMLGALVTLWVLQGLVLSDGRMPGELRYVFASLVLVMLVGVEALRGVKLSRQATIAVLVVLGAAVIGNAYHFRGASRFLDDYSGEAKAYFTVFEAGGPRITSDFRTDRDARALSPSPLSLSVGPFQDAVRKYGNPGYSVEQLAQQPDSIQQKANAMAARAISD